MRAYGIDRRTACPRKIRGTSRDCPCCVDFKVHGKVKDFKKTARRMNKKEISSVW